MCSVMYATGVLTSMCNQLRFDLQKGMAQAMHWVITVLLRDEARTGINGTRQP